MDHPDLFKNSFLLTGWLPNPTGSLDDFRDIKGHGTHVTGIMAARRNNSIGIVGLASNCKYLIGKSSPNASGLYYAIVDLVQKGAKVINRSGGTEDSSGYFTSAVQYANTYNVTLVASAGNNNASIEFPAALSKYFPNVIAVGATDPFDNKAPYSNHGVGLSVVAPGGTDRPYDSNDIVSTTPTYNFNSEFDEFGNEVVAKTFGFMAGTSMAAPLVTGTVALMLSVKSDLTPEQVRCTIQLTADDKGVTGYDENYGYGRLNAYTALLPLIQPTGLQKTNSTGSVSLTWNIHPSTLFLQYEIERRVNGSAWALIGVTTSTSFTDTDVQLVNPRFANDLIEYRIRIKNSNNVYSNYSTILAIQGNSLWQWNTKNDIVEIPDKYNLFQNNPNPFNPSTTITFQTPEQSHVLISIYNSLGQKIDELVNDIKIAGIHKVVWNANNLPIGVYLVKMQTEKFVATKKILFVK